jgi:plasmid replication initiation protein
MLMQFQNTGIVLIDVQEFKERLGISDKYADYRNLKKKVIESAINELNQKSHFNVTFKGVREGRAIKNLEFFLC